MVESLGSLSELQLWVIGLLLIYSIGMLGIGWVGRKRAGDIKGFSIAGANIGGTLAGFSIFATGFSASTFVGIPALFYNFGWPSFIIAILMPSVSVLAILVVTRRMKEQSVELDAYTVTELIGSRYESKTMLILVSLSALVLYLGLLVANLTAAGYLFQTGLGLTFNQGVLITVVLAGIYVGAGGMWSSIITDNIQAVGMLLVVVIALPIAILEVGGLNSMNQQLANMDPTLVQISEPEYWTPLTILGNFPYWFFIVLGFPYMLNRILTIRDTQQIKKLLLAFWFGAVVASIWMLSGGIAKVLNPELANPDSAPIWLIANILPTSVAAILLTSIFMAVMSSVDSVLHAAGAGVGNDIYRKVIAPVRGKDPESEEVDRKATLISKGSVLLFVIIPIYFVIYQTPPFLSLLLYWTTGFTIGVLVPPLLAGLFWQKTTTYAVILGSIVGGIGYILVDQYTSFTVWITSPTGAFINAIVLITTVYIEHQISDSPSVPSDALSDIKETFRTKGQRQPISEDPRPED